MTPVPPEQTEPGRTVHGGTVSGGSADTRTGFPAGRPDVRTFDAADVEATRRLMYGLVVPRPIAWVTTVDAAGTVNLAPFSFFTVVSTRPAMMGLAITPDHTSEVHKDTWRNLDAGGELVIHSVSEANAAAMHVSSRPLPRERSEVCELGLATAPSDLVAPPRLVDADSALECRVETRLRPGQEEFFVVRVLRAHVSGALSDEVGHIDIAALDPVARVGRHYAHLAEHYRLG